MLNEPSKMIYRRVLMPPQGFVCEQCGNCCINLSDAYQHSVNKSDIDMWKENDRDNILAWVDPIDLGNENFVYDGWKNPGTHDDVRRCPWLRKLPGKDKYICKIHDVKPAVCREYPKSESHAKKTGCSVFVLSSII
jgi:Fe-S-cluster containining protein